MPYKPAVQIGQKYNRLTIISLSHKDKYGKLYYNCDCDCGNKRVYLGTVIKHGLNKSCGCLRLELHTKHDGCKKPEYGVWCGIKTRCYRKSFKYYSYYGGRGITVCDRWRESFANFIEDMGKRPSPKHTIDRIDVNGNYEPSNCRWCTMLEQQENMRPKRLLGKGYTKNNNGWSVHLGNRFFKYCQTEYKAIELRKEAIEKREKEIQNYGKIAEVL